MALVTPAAIEGECHVIRTARQILAIGVLCAAGVAGGAAAQDVEGLRKPSAAAGHVLAEKFCTSCHLIGEKTDSAQVGPPTFRSIANEAGQNFDHIKQVLIKPHAPMPDMQLTGDEILDLVAYLDSLKPAGSAPLLPPGQLRNKPRATTPG